MPSRFRRRTLLKGLGAIAATTVIGMLATGCSSPSPPEGSGRSSGKIVLEEWNFSETRIAWQKKALQLYQKTHPNVDITWVTLPYGEMHEKLLMTVMARTGS